AAPVPRELRDTDESLDELDVEDEAAPVEARATDPDSSFGEEASTDISIEESPMESGPSDDGDDDELAGEPTRVREPRSDLPEEPTKPGIVGDVEARAKSEPPPKPASMPPKPASMPAPKPASVPPRPISVRPAPVPSIVIDPSLTDEEPAAPPVEEARADAPD